MLLLMFGHARFCDPLTSDYAVSVYQPQFAIIDNNYLILIVFTSGITFMPSYEILEDPPCSSSPGIRPSLPARLIRRNLLTEQCPPDPQRLRDNLDFCSPSSFTTIDHLSLPPSCSILKFFSA